MRVVAINGSARAGGNTAALIEFAFEPLRDAGVDCELVELAGKEVRGCTACGRCREVLDRQCHGRKDFGNEVIDVLAGADGMIFGSPTYFSGITPELKAALDRAFYVGRGNDDMFARKVGAAIVAVRRAGAMHVFDSINHYFLISRMLVVGSSYWNVGIGGAKGDVLADDEGVRTMRTLGENMAWALERTAG
ncbi:MAG: flavodoxin family protein [Coriobacteriales bacterium]|nr:flavodoxin family protein [Coriobacteriales bacterium]